MTREEAKEYIEGVRDVYLKTKFGDALDIATEALQDNPDNDNPYKWVKVNDGHWICPKCLTIIYSTTKRDIEQYHRFCGRCGMQMIGGLNNTEGR